MGWPAAALRRSSTTASRSESLISLAWDSRGETSGFQWLAERGDLVYGIQALTQDQGTLNAIALIRQNFHLIGE